MRLNILEKKITSYIKRDPKYKNEIKSDNAALVVSDDFVDLGFYVCIFSAPDNFNWTYFPRVRSVPIVLNKEYYRNEEYILNYFKKHKISKKSINSNLFPGYNFGDDGVLRDRGDYYSVLISVKDIDEFILWASEAIDTMVKFLSRKFSTDGKWWMISGFSELGNWTPMWVMMRSEKKRKIMREIYGDCRYPTDRMNEEVGHLISLIDNIKNAYFLEGCEKFLYFNSGRQTNLAFPYFEDGYENAENIIKLLKKRLDCVDVFDIPHFYESTVYGISDDLIGAREQLDYLIKSSKYYRNLLINERYILNGYIERMESNYSSALAFEGGLYR